MSEFNCNCCCQYSTPPWWVTMGFTPQQNTVTQLPQRIVPVSSEQAPAHPAATVTTSSSSNPTRSTSSNEGGILGTIGNVVSTPVNVAGNVLSDVVNGIGGVLGSIF